MAVDLARLAYVPVALSRRTTVRVDTSTELAAQVAARPQGKGLRHDGNGNVIESAAIKDPREISGLPTQITVRPIEILHAAGRLTAGTDGPLSPVSGLWPIVRYAWIFDTSGPRLRLTPDAMALRARLRGALSETLGIGLSSILGRTAIRARRGDCSIEIVDAELAVAEESLTAAGKPISVRQRGSVCPDYIAAAHDGAGTLLGFDTIESKGLFDDVRKGPSASALDLLRDATVQTQGLQVAERVLSGYGFCACVADSEKTQHWGTDLAGLQHGEVFALGVDPEEREAPLPRGEGAVSRRPGGGWAVRDRSRFERSAFDAARAQLLLWAGDEDTARKLLEQPPAERRGAAGDRTSARSDELGDFEGVELRIAATDDGPALRIFTGVDEDMLEAARSGDLAQVRGRRRERAQAREVRADGFEAIDETQDSGDASITRAVSVDEDGTRLEVELMGGQRAV